MAKTVKDAGEGAEVHYPGSWKPVNTVLAVLLCLSIAEMLFRSEFSVRLSSLFCTAVFGALTYLPLRNLVLGRLGRAYLKVSRRGISWRDGKLASGFAWGHIKGFSVVHIAPPDGKLFVIGVAFNDGARLSEQQKADKKLASQMSGGVFDGLLLPDLYDWKPAELAEYLNHQKDRYTGVGAATEKIYEK